MKRHDVRSEERGNRWINYTSRLLERVDLLISTNSREAIGRAHLSVRTSWTAQITSIPTKIDDIKTPAFVSPRRAELFITAAELSTVCVKLDAAVGGTASITGSTARDLRARAYYVTRRWATSHDVFRTRTLIGTALRTVAFTGLSRFNHAIAAEGLAIVVVVGVTPRKATAVTVRTFSDRHGATGCTAVGSASAQDVGGTNVFIVTARRTITVTALASLYDVVAAQRGTIRVVLAAATNGTTAITVNARCDRGAGAGCAAGLGASHQCVDRASHVVVTVLWTVTITSLADIEDPIPTLGGAVVIDGATASRRTTTIAREAVNDRSEAASCAAAVGAAREEVFGAGHPVVTRGGTVAVTGLELFEDSVATGGRAIGVVLRVAPRGAATIASSALLDGNV